MPCDHEVFGVFPPKSTSNKGNDPKKQPFAAHLYVKRLKALRKQTTPRRVERSIGHGFPCDEDRDERVSEYDVGCKNIHTLAPCVPASTTYAPLPSTKITRGSLFGTSVRTWRSVTNAVLRSSKTRIQ